MTAQELRGLGRDSYRRGEWYHQAFRRIAEVLGRSLTGWEMRMVELGWQDERSEVIHGH